MRILVVSDIHANLEALQSVVEKAGPVDATWCLGDITGYGPNPNECIDLVRELPNVECIRGNHDVAVLGDIDATLFNQEAKLSVQWQRNNLRPESKKFLNDLPDRIETAHVLLVHGSPRNPIWEYLLEPYLARVNFDHFSQPFCFVGHTHQPLICIWDNEKEVMEWGAPLIEQVVLMNKRMILNPGSVGQPRDYDARASYAIFDDEKMTWEVCRVEYDVAAVQKKILEANLPIRHAQRLSSGW
jgi:predicted phosphodiesterase